MDLEGSYDMNYTHEYSNYPDEIIELTNYKNVDDTIGNLINQIETLRANGDYIQATNLIREYASQLKRYNLDMTTINTLIEHIRNTQIRALDIVGQFLSLNEDEPISKNANFVWLGGDGNRAYDDYVSTSTTAPESPHDRLIWIGGDK